MACGADETPSDTAEESPTEAPSEAPAIADTATPAPSTDADDTDSETSEVEEAPALDLDLDLESSDTGLQYALLENCSDEVAETGNIVSVHYTGLLADGTKFDSSYDRGEPIVFPVGKGFVIPGWDEGLGLMSAGCTAKFVIPPELAYGAQGAGGVIPPNATLVFDVELVDIRQGAPETPPEVDEGDYESHDRNRSKGVVVRAL